MRGIWGNKWQNSFSYLMKWPCSHYKCCFRTMFNEMEKWSWNIIKRKQTGNITPFAVWPSLCFKKTIYRYLCFSASKSKFKINKKRSTLLSIIPGVLKLWMSLIFFLCITRYLLNPPQWTFLTFIARETWHDYLKETCFLKHEAEIWVDTELSIQGLFLSWQIRQESIAKCREVGKQGQGPGRLEEAAFGSHFKHQELSWKGNTLKSSFSHLTTLDQISILYWKFQLPRESNVVVNVLPSPLSIPCPLLGRAGQRGLSLRALCLIGQVAGALESLWHTLHVPLAETWVHFYGTGLSFVIFCYL